MEFGHISIPDKNSNPSYVVQIYHQENPPIRFAVEEWSAEKRDRLRVAKVQNENKREQLAWEFA